MPDESPWKNTDSTLKELFSQTSAFAELSGRARTLTLGDLMRLSYFSRPGDKPPLEDGVLKHINLEDMNSVARAMEVYLRETGNEEGWRYTGEVFSCCPCAFCAATLPTGGEE